jgi:hypothetical protein
MRFRIGTASFACIITKQVQVLVHGQQKKGPFVDCHTFLPVRRINISYAGDVWNPPPPLNFRISPID